MLHVHANFRGLLKIIYILYIVYGVVGMRERSYFMKKKSFSFFGVTSWLFAVQEQEGATLLVSVKFDIVSTRNIYLQFEEVSFPAIYET